MKNLSHACFVNSSRHPQLSVLTVQPLHVRRHRTRVRLRFAQTLVEAALQSELSHTLLLLDHSTHLEQAIGRSNISDSGGVATAHDDAVFGLLENLKVIGDDGADLVAALEEILALPELVGGLGTLVLPSEDGALSDIACD